MSEPTIAVPTDDLFEHAKALALEHPDNFDDHTDESVEWSINDIDGYHSMDEQTHRHVDEDDETCYIFHCDFEVTVSERVNRATRWHPAEYENRDVEVMVDLILYLSRNNYLGGVDVYAESGPNPFAPKHESW